MSRPYDMTARSRAAAATRAGIIAAAHRLLNGREGGALALHEVAREAAVTRATIYKSIGARHVLLAAVFEDQGRLIGFERVLAAMQGDDAASAILATVRASGRAWAVMPGAIRRTLALAAMDAEVARLVRRYEGYRRARLAALAARAHRAGVLRPGVTARAAATTLALTTGFPAFDQLLIDRSPQSATDHLVRLTGAALGVAMTRRSHDASSGQRTLSRRSAPADRRPAHRPSRRRRRDDGTGPD